MPNIREYNQPALGLQPSEVGVEATAAAARRGGAFFNQAAQALATTGERVGSSVRDAGAVADQYLAFQDRSKLNVAASSALSNLENSWSQKLNGVPDSNNPGQYLRPPADPNNPSVAAEFRETQVQPFIDKLQEIPTSDGGRRYAEQLGFHINQHWIEKTTADLGTMAKNAAIQNHNTTANNLGSMLATSPDIHTARFVLDRWREAASNTPLTVTGPERSQLDLHNQNIEQKLIHAGAISAIMKSPDPEATAKQWIKEFPDLIKGDEANQFAKAAVAQNKTNLATQKAIDSYDHTQNVRTADAALSRNWTDNMTFDENGKATVKPGFFKNITQIEAKFPGMVTPRSHEMIKFAQAEMARAAKGETVTTDPAVQSRLYAGLFDADKPTTDVDILKAATLGQLNNHDRMNLINLQKAIEEQPLRGRSSKIIARSKDH